jgi:hypothetical protein
MILIPKLKLGYQNVPKVATTSLFAWLYQAHEGVPGSGSASPGKKDWKRRFFLRGDAARIARNDARGIAGAEGFYRFALTRDPVRRFLSMYSNRVVHYRELSRAASCAAGLEAAGLRFDPQINELIAELHAYLRVARSIRHHARPQIDFIGPDLSVYTRIADISSVNTVAAEIRDHWTREGFTGICRRTPPVPGREQTGGPKLGLHVLTPDSFEALLDFYREDYARIPTLDIEATRKEYLEARESGEHAPVVFPAALRSRSAPGRSRAPRKEASGTKAPSKKAQRKEAAPERGPRQGGPGKEARAARVVRKERCALATLVRIDARRNRGHARPDLMTGAVVLEAGAPEGYRLVADCGGEPRKVRWGIASPGLSAKFPGNPHAARARFRIARAAVPGGEPLRIYLESTDGRRELLATVGG